MMISSEHMEFLELAAPVLCIKSGYRSGSQQSILDGISMKH